MYGFLREAARFPTVFFIMLMLLFMSVSASGAALAAVGSVGSDIGEGFIASDVPVEVSQPPVSIAPLGVGEAPLSGPSALADHEGSVLRVDPSSEDEDAFESIQDAVDAAQPGDRIRVADGVYKEHVVIGTSDLVLEGEENATLEGDRVLASGFEVLASRVSILGFRIQGYDDAGVLATGDGADGLRVEGNIVREGASFGILVRSGEGARVAGNLVHDVEVGIGLEQMRHAVVENNTLLDISEYAIRVGPDPVIDLTDVVAAGTDLVPGVDDAVDLLFDVINEIPPVTVPLGGEGARSALLPGPVGSLEESLSANNEVIGNQVYGCGVGILLSGSSADRVEDNHVAACLRGLEADEASGPEIHGNAFVDNDGIGLFLVGTSSATLTDNRMDGNAYGMDVFTSYAHDIDTSNTVDGAPVHYYTDEVGLTIEGPMDIGFLAVINSVDVTLRDLDISGLRTGPMLISVQGALLERLTLTENVDGLRIAQPNLVELRDSHVRGNQAGLVVAQTADLARGLTVVNTTFEENGMGVDLHFSTVLTTFEKNTFTNNSVSGISAFVENPPTVRDLHIIENRFVNNGPATSRGGPLAGNIAVSGSPGNALIAHNHIEGGSSGISVRNAGAGLKIQDNTIQDTRHQGVYLTNNNGLVLTGNQIHGNKVGLEFWGGEAHVLRHNKLYENDYNLHMRFFTNLDLPNTPGAHSIDTTNTVDGRPVHYYYGEPVVTIDATDDPGYVAVVEAQHVTIRGLELSGNAQGIVLSHVGRATIEDVTVQDTLQAIHMIEAHNVHVSGSHLAPDATAPDRGIGLEVLRSGTVTIEGNTFAQAYHGVRISLSEDVHVRDNHFDENRIPQADGSTEGDGVYVFFSENIVIENNAFSENRRGVILDCCPITNGGRLATVENNHFANNDDAIVLQMFRDEAVVRGNTIEHNGRGIVVSEYFPQAHAGKMGDFDITGNTIAGNRAYGVYNAVTGDGNIVSATGNHWGANNGPSSPAGRVLEDPETGEKANGRGDCISQGTQPGVANVAFGPFLAGEQETYRSDRIVLEVDPVGRNHAPGCIAE